ncbi:MAG: ribbon-helix-helix protein, CopG family [Deltaproteobacteria bacterium]|nr:ribbon-helix-helix protein, CopG family [Deltaproteobacteria bacterium]
MKKRITRTTDPLDSEVDFTLLGPVRRNAFAGADERGGPSLLALWEMPELTSDSVLLRRGRPGKAKSRKTVVRSVRLPAEMWEELEAKARAKHLNVHQAMRAALVGWLRRPGT